MLPCSPAALLQRPRAAPGRRLDLRSICRAAVAQTPATQEAGNPAPAQLAEPGGLMSLDRLDRIGDVFTV